MRGLIYKELTVFFKTMDKRVPLVLIAVSIFLFYQAGSMAALFVVAMTALLVAMQNVTSFSLDEKVGWDQYQLTLPVSPAALVISKYLAALCSTAASIGVCVIVQLAASLLRGGFDWSMWGLSLLVSAGLPLAYLSITLPLVYWFGHRSADIMRIVIIFPMCFGMGYLIELGELTSPLAAPVPVLLAVSFGCVLVLLGLSMAVSLAGCRRRMG